MAGEFPAYRQARQRGVALLTALLLMLAVLMTGIAAARSVIASARIAGHERERMLALQGAMAGLRDAERDIEGGVDPASSRAVALAHADPAAFADGCRGGAPYDGLCRQAGGAIHAALADPQGPGVVLGAYSGVAMPLGGGALAAQAPRYLIERMPSGPEAILYRITALGFGSVETSQAAVQAYYRKLLPPSPPSPSTPGPEPGTEAPPGTAPGAPDGPRAPDAPNGPEAPEPAAPSGDGGDNSGGNNGSGPAPGNPEPAPPTTGPGSPGGPGIRVGWREIGNWQDTMVAYSSRTERR